MLISLYLDAETSITSSDLGRGLSRSRRRFNRVLGLLSISNQKAIFIDYLYDLSNLLICLKVEITSEDLLLSSISITVSLYGRSRYSNILVT